MKSLLKRISERRGVCVWMRRKRGIGACRFLSNEHSECIASGHPCIASGHSP